MTWCAATQGPKIAETMIQPLEAPQVSISKARLLPLLMMSVATPLVIAGPAAAAGPSVTPQVTGGQLTASGYYTGSPTIHWNVDGSATATSGCEDTVVAEDTTGREFSCTATSAAGSTTGSITIRRDATPPRLSVPADVHYRAKPGSIVTMTYQISPSDSVDQDPHLSCLPRSGSRFPVGRTTVNCTAKDFAGNTTRNSFDIFVSGKSNGTASPARTPRLTVRAYRLTKQGSQLLGVKVNRITRRSVVTVSCDRRCPKALRKPVTRMSHGTSLSLATLFHRSPLRAGAKITVTTSGPGIQTRSHKIAIRADHAPVIRG